MREGKGKNERVSARPDRNRDRRRKMGVEEQARRSPTKWPHAGHRSLGTALQLVGPKTLGIGGHFIRAFDRPARGNIFSRYSSRAGREMRRCFPTIRHGNSRGR